MWNVIGILKMRYQLGITVGLSQVDFVNPFEKFLKSYFKNLKCWHALLTPKYVWISLTCFSMPLKCFVTHKNLSNVKSDMRLKFI